MPWEGWMRPYKNKTCQFHPHPRFSGQSPIWWIVYFQYNVFNFQINVVSLAYAHETMDVVRNQQNLTREAVCLGSPENTGLLHRWTGQPGTSWRQNKLERFSDRIWGDNTHCHPVSACGKRSCTSIEVVFCTRRTLVRNGLPRHTEQTKHAPGCFS